MSKASLFGIVKLSLCCAAETLGMTVDVSIGGVNGKLSLPSLPEWDANEKDPLGKPLLGPGRARTWKEGGKLIFWGSPHSYPCGESIVERALFEFPQDSDNYESNAKRIHSGFSAWLNIFEQYVILLATRGKCSRVSVENARSNRLQLGAFEDSCDRMKHITFPAAITVSMVTGGDLRREQFKEICRMSSLLLPPRLEYLLLLEAYMARKNEDYRKAIIEAANALEVSLTNRIKDEFTNQGVTFGDELMKKFRMLGGRFELARIMGIQIPQKDYDKLIIQPRNDVVHKAGFPDEKLAAQVISEVEKILQMFSPIIHEDSPMS